MDTPTPETTAPLQAKSILAVTTLDTEQLYEESPGTKGEERVTPGQEDPVATDAAVTSKVEIGSHVEAPSAAHQLIAHNNADHHTNAKEALHPTIMRSVMFSLQDHTLGTPKVNYRYNIRWPNIFPHSTTVNNKSQM